MSAAQASGQFTERSPSETAPVARSSFFAKNLPSGEVSVLFWCLSILSIVEAEGDGILQPGACQLHHPSPAVKMPDSTWSVPRS
jgi:hypothetical protein